MIARLAYAALFALALPLLLVAWAARLDALLALPEVHWPVVGWSLAICGLGLALSAVRDLWVHGHGLPASPFPPERLVTRGSYALVRDPIYVGTVLLALGTSLGVGSASGLWIVTPVLAMACTGWVWGFERDLTRRLFGTVGEPRLRLPRDGAGVPSMADRSGVIVLVLAPWLALFMAVETFGAPDGALSTLIALDARVPVLPWTEMLYVLTYPYVLFAVFVARERSDLARFARDGLWAIVIVIPFYLLVPLVAEAKPVPSGSGLLLLLMRWERAYDAPITAFPAFHVVWAFIATRVYVARWPRARAAWMALALAQAASGVTTGMHATLDIVGGAAAWLLVDRRDLMWGWIRGGAERMANSGREWTLGPLRLSMHGLHTGFGAAVGVLVAIALAGSDASAWIVGTTVACVLGAAVWAQLIEGSPQLLRPYGYYGSLVTALASFVVLSALDRDAWLIAASFAIGAAFAQAIGRVRCLVNGCCHGRACDPGIGVVVTNPLSRVVRLAGLGGTPIHATQLYSLAWLVVTGAALVRLWIGGAPLSFIGGAYLILTGAGRFVEEHYRGEPQTAVIGGLRLYQWLSLLSVVTGAVISAFATAAASPVPRLHPSTLAWALGVGTLTYVAFGVDWPSSDRPYSRLR